MAKIDILLRTRTSGWVSVHNNGGGNSVKTAEFLAKADKAGSFDHVCFGDHGYANAATHAMKLEHIIGFQGWALEHGLHASFDHPA